MIDYGEDDDHTLGYEQAIRDVVKRLREKADELGAGAGAGDAFRDAADLIAREFFGVNE